tara:strand:+ start:335 stop:1090 length:756 start_codon:yes stop_codon:yes gene_type:complete
MKIYLAGFKTIEKIYDKPTKDIYLLSSFWEHKTGKFGEYVKQENHILDSGAFSAINDKTGKYKNFDWDGYVKKYIAFIKQTNQKLFFELDIDCVVGLKKVEYYRKQIEDAVGIAPIICWHSNRGGDYWIKSCEDYDYVALGTTRASNDGKKIRANPNILETFINIAHKNNAKIHGLGFTSTPWLKKLKFDSVDSTTWNVGGKFGNCVVFDKDGFPTQRYKTDLSKKAITNKINIYNFEQWVKFQKFALNNL